MKSGGYGGWASTPSFVALDSVSLCKIKFGSLEVEINIIGYEFREIKKSIRGIKTEYFTRITPL